MFPEETYVARRQRLVGRIDSGLLLFLGNDECPMNYTDNPYPFRQDSSFLYFFGLDRPGLAALIDVDEGTETIYGDDPTVEEIVWTGPQPLLAERAQEVGVKQVASLGSLHEALQTYSKQGGKIHFLPSYRAEQIVRLERLLGVHGDALHDGVSVPLIQAVVEQRSVKSEEEVGQIEAALEILREMHTTAMAMTKPDVYECEVAGIMEGIALLRGGRLAFPTIFSIHGETLHNHDHSNIMREGDLVVNDSGAESPLHYSSDVTRTIPVGGRFTARQREIYTIVLEAQERGIEAIRPGAEFREVHRLAAACLTSGLKDLGLMQGDADEAVEAGAHTLFFPCGVGHMLGLDVHDMEGLGEDHVGYTETIKRRPDFGWRSLRLARALEPGFVVTVEPGIYFIPQLIDRWKADKKHTQFINYEAVETYRDFGGVRIEDDLLVTDGGHRLLGKPIPRTIDEVEALASV
jgi:Xaa-Pro aminopeptidase